jgi:zinc protease
MFKERPLMMKRMHTFLFQLPVVIILSGLFAAGSPVQAEIVDLSGMSTLKNGFDVRLMPENSTPVVAALVLVQTGYASESSSKRGFSHLLEHLVFAGTEKRTKDSIQREVKDLGGYINGFTRDDYTGYLIVGHRDHLDQLLSILADILFNSTISEQAVAEAKEVVVEEVRRSQSRPGTREEELFQSLLYEGSPYATTGLGNETTVRAAGRDEIAEFHDRTYRPNNMILLLKGGFDRAEAMEAVRRSFGGQDMGPVNQDVMKPTSLLAQRTYLLASTMPDVRVRIGFSGPDPRGPDAQALELLSAVLGGTEGVLDQALKGAGMQPRSVSAALSINAGFSRFVVSAILPSGSDPVAAQKVLLEAIPAALALDDFADKVTQTRESLVAGEVLGREKLHYYLMGKAPWVIAGSPGQGFSSGRWDDLTRADLDNAARKYLVEAPFVGLLTVPESRVSDYSGPKGPVRAEAMLDNGLRVVAEQRSGSPVFALHVMTRHRMAVEPEGKTGIADFLHRLLPLGTYSRNREDIDSNLRKLGISLSTAGNPMVPFGDFYTSRLYSHIRLQCVEDKARSAVTLLSDMVTNPLLEEGAVEETRSRILDFISYRNSSPGTLASGALAQRLYSPVLAADVYGTESSISGISKEDLFEFHRSYFTGQNLIISVVSGMPLEESIALVEEYFNELPAGEKADVPPIPLTVGSDLVEMELGKPQGALAVGAVTGDMDRADAQALAIASGLLNTRLYEELREKEGLAYSLGASLGEVEGRAVFTLSMGTAPDKIQRARESVRTQVEAARNASVTGKELEREINGLVGRLQMRMLSSINRAYYLGVATRRGLVHTFGEDYRERLLALTPEDVERATRRYLPEGNVVEVVIR